MGKKRKHSVALRTVVLVLGRIFGDERVQHKVNIDVAPADNPTSEPEPDVLVTARSYVEFAVNPQPDDVLLLVEVADSTVRFDRTTKARLYARAGIREYWVMDSRRRRLLVHREPQGERYASITEYEEAESVRALPVPDQEILVSALFGPSIAAE